MVSSALILVCISVRSRSRRLHTFCVVELERCGLIRNVTRPFTRNNQSLGIPRQTSACASNGYQALLQAMDTRQSSHTHGEPGDEPILQPKSLQFIFKQISTLACVAHFSERREILRTDRQIHVYIHTQDDYRMPLGSAHRGMTSTVFS